MARYEICVGGHLGEMIRAAFADLRIQVRGGDTVLSGVMADQAALFGVLRQVEALGLELIEVRRVPLCGPDGLKESLSHVVRVVSSPSCVPGTMTGVTPTRAARSAPIASAIDSPAQGINAL
jgi:hypothetical protein